MVYTCYTFYNYWKMNVNSWVLFFTGWAWFSYNILPCTWWILTIIHILCSTLKGTLCFFVFLVINSSHSTFLHVVVKTLHKTWLSSKHCCSWNKMDGLAILPWEQVISVCHGELSCALLSLLKWCRQIEVFPGVVNILQFFYLLNYSFVILQGITTEKCMSCCKCLSTWCTWWDHDISNGGFFL